MFARGLLILFLASLSISALAQSEKNMISFPMPLLSWSGDLRYRLADTKEDLDEKRTYQQLRARLALKAEIEEDLMVSLRLATGTSAISTNQTLGDPKDPGMSRRSFGLDLAFINWVPSKEHRISAGRIPNPFWSPAKVQLVFDSDLSFEGFAYQIEPRWSHSKAFLNLGAFLIAENYDTAAREDATDTALLGIQGGYSEKTEWGTGTVHLGYFEYVGIQDKNITTIDKDAKVDIYSTPFDRYKGNSVYRPDILVANYFYQNSFRLQELGAEWEFSLDSFKLVAFYDSVENTTADNFSRGSEYGLALKFGRTQISWAAVEKQAEAVLGAFTDSDSNGGGTDNRGTRLALAYYLSNYSQVQYTQFVAKRGIDTVERDFRSSQLEFLVTF